MHIIWKKPSLNKQKHVSISITVWSSFLSNYYFHFILSFPFIPSRALLSSWIFDLVPRCILNFNKLLFCKKIFNWYFYQNLFQTVLCYVLKFIYWQRTIGEDTPETSLVFMNKIWWNLKPYVSNFFLIGNYQQIFSCEGKFFESF